MLNNVPARIVPHSRLKVPSFTVERTEVLLQNARWILQFLLLNCRWFLTTARPYSTSTINSHFSAFDHHAKLIKFHTLLGY